MPTNYNYSNTLNFPNGLQEGQLMREIENSSTILVKIISIVKIGDDIDMLFESALSASEETELNIIIANHVPITGKETINITFSKSSVKTSTYQMVVAFGYKGSREAGSIETFKVVSKKDETATDYSVRVYDVNNNKVLVEETFTNNKDEVHVLSNINNVPD